jgi:dihydrodipicolinate synthase/N-acetylneuraminate lyase
MHAIHGIIPPIVTPFDPAGRIHEEALARLIDWYAAAGCHGLWVCGGTGEGVSLTNNERLRMAELVSEHASGRLSIIFHVAAVTTADAVLAAQRCQQLGVEAICSVPPFFYGKSLNEIVEYYRRIADETDRPIFLYNLPDASGVPLTLPLVEAIVDRVPTVVGIKQSAGVVDYVHQLLRWNPNFNVLIGRGETTLAALTLGATGVVCASLCLAPERFVAVYQAFLDGDLRHAMEAQREASRVKELYERFPVIASTKWLNGQQIGIDCGPVRPPLGAVPDEQLDALREMAAELGLFERAPAALEASSELTVKPR